MNRSMGIRAVLCLAMCSLGTASIIRAQGEPPPFDEKRAAALIENQFVITGGYLFLASDPAFTRLGKNSLQLALTGKMAYSLKMRPAASDNPGFRFLLHAEVANYDMCNVYPAREIPTDKLWVWHEDRFYLWEDLVQPRIRSDGRQRYQSRPIVMDKADLDKARECMRGPGGGYAGSPIESLQIQLGDAVASTLFFGDMRRGSRERRTATCLGSASFTRVLINPIPGVNDHFSVSARALSALRCTWPDGRTRLFTDGLVLGESAPIEFQPKGKNDKGRFEFVLEDLGPLWKTPVFPKYETADVEAALDEPLQGGVCAAEFMGHRITIFYEGKTMLDRELEIEKACVPET